MPRYESKLTSSNQVTPVAIFVGIVSVLSAVLVSTGLLGALIWFNIFIWDKVF